MVVSAVDPNASAGGVVEQQQDTSGVVSTPAVQPTHATNEVAALGGAFPLASLAAVQQMWMTSLVQAAQMNAEEWLRATPELGQAMPEAPTELDPNTGMERGSASAKGSAAPKAAAAPKGTAAVAAAVPGKTSVGTNQTLSQLSPQYTNARLGTGQRTIRQSGCLLTSLTMAANRLNGSSYDLQAANDQVVAGGGFSGSDLAVDKAAGALGLTLQSRQVATPKSFAEAHQALESGKALVVAGVDYKPGKSSSVSNADHFLLIKGPTDPTADRSVLYAVDPAGGREFALTRQPDGSYTAGKYRVTELAVLSSSHAVPAVAPRRIAV